MNVFPKSILIADDEKGFRDLCRFVLEPLGFKITTAGNGEEALNMVKQQTFDLLILDVHMPYMGGLDVWAKIRGIRPKQKVIMISNGIKKNDPRAKAIREGVSAYLFKPFGMYELIASIERCLGINLGIGGVL